MTSTELGNARTTVRLLIDPQKGSLYRKQRNRPKLPARRLIRGHRSAILGDEPGIVASGCRIAGSD